MRENWGERVLGHGVVLVPYRRWHVARYHEWMQSAELLEATASEPLTLEEEYDMQKKWRDDADKCTFIVLDAGRSNKPIDVAAGAMDMANEEEQGGADVAVEAAGASVAAISLDLQEPGVAPPASSEDALPAPSAPPASSKDALPAPPAPSASSKDAQPAPPTSPKDVAALDSLCVDRMIGDVNLFFHEFGSRECAEIEVMIAELSGRRRGLAVEALQLLMAYARTKLGTRSFVAKIGAKNAASLALFEHKLGFKRTAFVEAFDEHTLTFQEAETIPAALLQILPDTHAEIALQ